MGLGRERGCAGFPYSATRMIRITAIWPANYLPVIRNDGRSSGKVEALVMIVFR